MFVKRVLTGVVTAVVAVAGLGGCAKHASSIEGDGVADGDILLPIGTWRVVSGSAYGWDKQILDDYASQTGGPPSMTFDSDGGLLASLPGTSDTGAWAVQDGQLLLTFDGDATSFSMTEDGDDLKLDSGSGDMLLTPYKSEDFTSSSVIPTTPQSEDTAADDTASGSDETDPAAPLPGLVREKSKTGEAQYGQTYQWDNGIYVTLDTPSMLEGTSAYVTVTVPIHIINDTGKPWPVSDMWIEVLNGGEDATLEGTVASAIGIDELGPDVTANGVLKVSVARPSYTLVVGLGDPDSMPVVYH